MAKKKVLNVGLVGAVGRGGSFANSFTVNGARIHAVCDIQEDKLDACAERLGASEAYTDYDEMLARSELDAVFIGTPMPLHVPQSVKALERGLHVLCEVPAAVSIEECRTLVSACRKSKALYMMSENYCYARMCTVVREIARKGLFGDLFYAEGEYLHELKQMNEDTPWRRKWQTGIDGITYGTHSLGPILQWMAGDRVARVCVHGRRPPLPRPARRVLPRGEPRHALQDGARRPHQDTRGHAQRPAARDGQHAASGHGRRVRVRPRRPL